MRDCFHQRMSRLAVEIAEYCRVCAKTKKQEVGVTPILSYVGKNVHVDVFSTVRKYFHTSIASRFTGDHGRKSCCAATHKPVRHHTCMKEANGWELTLDSIIMARIVTDRNIMLFI